MKTISKIFLFLAVISIAQSCKKDDELEINLDKSFLLGRWEAVNSTDDLVFIEFNDQNHYIIELTDPDYSNESMNFGGNYSVTSDDSFTLDDVEDVEIVKKDGDNITVKVMKSSNDYVEYNLKKKAPLYTSENSKKLSRTWRISKIDGIDAAAMGFNIALIMSNHGEMFMQVPVPTGMGFEEIIFMKADWKWTDSTEDEICMDNMCDAGDTYSISFNGQNLVLTSINEDIECAPMNSKLVQVESDFLNKKPMIFNR